VITRRRLQAVLLVAVMASASASIAAPIEIKVRTMLRERPTSGSRILDRLPAGKKVPMLGQTVRDVLGSVGWTEQAPSATGAVRERWESLNALVGLADQVAVNRPGARLPDFIAELDERAEAQHAPTVDGVTLASLHAAKGLEWDAVALSGVHEGSVPFVLATLVLVRIGTVGRIGTTNTRND